MSPAPDVEHEARLVFRIATRDSQAVGELYDCLGKWVFSLVLLILKDRRDAEEVTQEVFLQVWRRAGLYAAERGSVRAWIAVMARRLAIDRTRGRGYRESKRVGSTDGLAYNPSDTAAEQQITAGAESRLVRDAMNRLGEGQEEVIRLSYYYGYSHGEIAEKLNVPLGTVKTRIRTGMKQLRELLGIEV